MWSCAFKGWLAAPYQNSVMWMHVSSLPTNSSLQNTPRYQLFIEIGDH
jgi:hypothetical protein